MTVGIVLVSHSAALADATARVAGQLVGGPRIRAAGGTDDGGLGTSAELVAAAIAGADDGDGVVLIPDLGSAVLTARLVMQQSADRSRLVLADAPFVEGAVAAVAAAAAGLDADAVAAAARQAREIPKC